MSDTSAPNEKPKKPLLDMSADITTDIQPPAAKPTEEWSQLSFWQKITCITLLEKHFTNPYRAINYLKLKILLWVIIYIGWHAISTLSGETTVYPWNCGKENSDGTIVPCEEKKSPGSENAASTDTNTASASNSLAKKENLKRTKPDWLLYGPVFLGSNAPLDIQIRYENMRKYLAQEQISRTRTAIIERVEPRRENLLRSRQSLIKSVKTAARSYGSESFPPYILANSSGQDTGPTIEDAKRADLYLINNWFVEVLNHYGKSSVSECLQTKHNSTERLFHNLPVLKERTLEEEFCIDRTRDLLNTIKNIQFHIDAEEAEFYEIYQNLPFLRPELSFQWLYHEDMGWIWELVAWTVIGVLINSLLGVQKAMQKDRLLPDDQKNHYDPGVYMTVFPQILYAPILAIVVIAMFAAGLTESGILVVNLPYFLVLSFALGFGNERVVRIVKTGIKAVLGGMTFSKERLAEEAALAARYRAQYSEGRILYGTKPKSLKEVRQRASSVAKSSMESVFMDTMRRK